MFSRTGPRQSPFFYAVGILMTLALFAGCGDSVPTSPNTPPPRPAMPGVVELHNPETLLKAKAEARAARNAPKGKIPAKHEMARAAGSGTCPAAAAAA